MNIKLSKVQQEIIQHNEGPLLVIAGPGSGKTSVLTARIERIISGTKGNFRILALTFTNKAANEMKERLIHIKDIDERVYIGTIHRFCLDVLNNHGKHVGIENTPTIIDSYHDRRQILIDCINNDTRISDYFWAERINSSPEKVMTNWLDDISTLKNNLILPDMVNDSKQRIIYESYNNLLKLSKAIDFDDVLILTYKLFIERPKIADFYRRQYKYICIDEAQDLNEARYQLIRALCGNNYNNVMMVGDPKQAIFTFNGASPKYLDIFKHDFNANVIEIFENYRSSAAVVNVEKVINPNYTIRGKLPIEGSVKLIKTDNETEEARLVLDYLNTLIINSKSDPRGEIKLENCAILGRTRYVLDPIENELKIRNWKYHKHLPSQLDSESDLLRNFELCLKVYANPHDRLHLGLLFKRWKLENNMFFKNVEFNNSEEFLKAMKLRINKPDQLIILKAMEEVGGINDRFNINKSLKVLTSYANNIEITEERELILEDIKIWSNHWDTYLRTYQGSNHNIQSFFTQIALGTTQQPNNEGISLLTVHSSKGMEFDVVAIIGMNDGIFPDYRAIRSNALEEERRNMFVAVSRSKRILIFSYPENRLMLWNEVKHQKKSRFLDNIDFN